jgi:5,10-methylenetetrahydrofolate reductase
MMECPFCHKKVEVTQRLKIFSRYRNICKKCERGVKIGVVVGAMLVEESKKPRTIFKPSRTKMVKAKIKIRRG